MPPGGRHKLRKELFLRTGTVMVTMEVVNLSFHEKTWFMDNISAEKKFKRISGENTWGGASQAVLNSIYGGPPFCPYLSAHLHQACGSWNIQVTFPSPPISSADWVLWGTPSCPEQSAIPSGPPFSHHHSTHCHQTCNRLASLPPPTSSAGWVLLAIACCPG